MAGELSHLHPQRGIRKKATFKLPAGAQKMLDQAEANDQPRSREVCCGDNPDYASNCSDDSGSQHSLTRELG